MRDVEIIKLLIDKDGYNKYRQAVIPEACCNEASIIIKDLDTYYEANKNKEFNFERFITWFHQIKHPDISFDDREFYNKFFKAVEGLETLPIDITEALTKRTVEQKLKDAILNEDIETVDAYKEIIDEAIKNKQKVLEEPWIKDDLDEIAELLDFSKGLSWRLPELNEYIGPLISGVFGVVAARVGMGKTSFFASEVTKMVQSLEEDEMIFWFNNENVGQRIKQRLYCAMFNKTWPEIIQNKEKAKAKFKEVGGDRIKVIDIHSQSYKLVEKYVKEYRPRLVILDMLDYIHGFESRSRNMAVDGRFELLYEWALDLSCSYCPVLAASQLNKQAENKPFPDLSLLQGSGTAKQGKASFVLFIGAENTNGISNIRYLSTPKNKYGGKYLKTQVLLDSERSRYSSLLEN